MASSKREIRAALKKSGGTFVEPLDDAPGPTTMTYHDPETGQEFPNLPMDPWSLETYMKRHGWMLGEASPALRAQWEETQENLVDPLDEYRDEGNKLVTTAQNEAESKNSGQIGELIGLIGDLAKEVAGIKAMVMPEGQEHPNDNIDAKVTEDPDEEIVPVQIAMFEEDELTG